MPVRNILPCAYVRQQRKWLPLPERPPGRLPDRASHRSAPAGHGSLLPVAQEDPLLIDQSFISCSSKGRYCPLGPPPISYSSQSFDDVGSQHSCQGLAYHYLSLWPLTPRAFRPPASSLEAPTLPFFVQYGHRQPRQLDRSAQRMQIPSRGGHQGSVRSCQGSSDGGEQYSAGVQSCDRLWRHSWAVLGSAGVVARGRGCTRDRVHLHGELRSFGLTAHRCQHMY